MREVFAELIWLAFDSVISCWVTYFFLSREIPPLLFWVWGWDLVRVLKGEVSFLTLRLLQTLSARASFRKSDQGTVLHGPLFIGVCFRYCSEITLGALMHRDDILFGGHTSGCTVNAFRW